MTVVGTPGVITFCWVGGPILCKRMQRCHNLFVKPQYCWINLYDWLSVNVRLKSVWWIMSTACGKNAFRALIVPSLHLFFFIFVRALYSKWSLHKIDQLLNTISKKSMYLLRYTWFHQLHYDNSDTLWFLKCAYCCNHWWQMCDQKGFISSHLSNDIENIGVRCGCREAHDEGL